MTDYTTLYLPIRFPVDQVNCNNCFLCQQDPHNRNRLVCLAWPQTITNPAGMGWMCRFCGRRRTTPMDAFNTLYKIDCNGHTEQKNGLTYLSWAWAWAEIKKAFPGSSYTIYENANGWCYHTDGKTCWVKTGVTICDGTSSLEHIEYLPVMDHRNKSIPLEQVTSFDVNKAIQRSLTKAAARHGLGLYIYAGEDLPESDPVLCTDCGKEITATKKSSVSELVQRTTALYSRPLCSSCATAEYKRNEAKHAGSGVIMMGEPIESNG